MRKKTVAAPLLAAILLAAATAPAGVVFPGASERGRAEANREEMLRFYRRFAPKALEMEAWSRGLDGEEAESMIRRALRFTRDGSAPAGNLFRHRQDRACTGGRGRACGREGGGFEPRTPARPRRVRPAPASKPGPARPVLVVSVPRGTPERDVVPVLKDALAEGRRRGLEVVLRVEVAGPREVAKWSRVAPEDVSLELVRASAGDGSDAGATPRVETEYRR